MIVKSLVYLLCSILTGLCSYGQNVLVQQPGSKEQIPPYTNRERSWWNLLHYDISIRPDYPRKFISGKNEITFRAIKPGDVLQIDLQAPMEVKKMTWKNKPLPFSRQKDVYLARFPHPIKPGETHKITVFFEGKPAEALKPPFDNGWIWAKDEKGRPWMSVACQGSGASIWLPCKDVLYDEPDKGMLLHITVPDTLSAVANGKLHGKFINNDGWTTYSWKLVNPVNNYNIIPYIGKYVSWQTKYPGLEGKLNCDFRVLDYNLEKGKKHFRQTDTMLRAFEYWLGPYPFYKDGYKLVEAPMMGMEHQSAVAYGNGFQNGNRGKDNISGTGWGLKWDFILVHESGHEWFGNNITSGNHSDTWIHEGFIKYLETLYTDFVFGREAGNEYALGTWKRIKNDQPILGTNTSDKYYKASAMLHSLRQVIGDTVFRGWLQDLQRQFYHSTVNTEQVLNHLNAYTKKEFSKVFAQYLQTTQVPTLEYSLSGGELQFRWINCLDGFDMPLKIVCANAARLIYPTTQWQKMPVEDQLADTITVDKNFYIQTRIVK